MAFSTDSKFYSCLYTTSNKNILWPWQSGLNGILSARASVNKFIMRSDRIKMERNK